MYLTVTIKAEATSHDELIDDFGGRVANLRQHCEELKKEGVFGPPDKCELRYLIIGGGWRESERVAQEHGTPDVAEIVE